MTDDASAAAPEPESKAGHRKPSRTLARQVWFESGKPSFRQLEEILAARGYAVDHTRLQRWSKDDPIWCQAILENTAPPPEKILTALQGAKEDATELVPEVYMGVKAQLVGRLYQAIKTMPLTTIDEWLRGLDACERIESLIHAERGKAVAAKDTIAIPRGAAPSLIARLDPNVKLAPFRKPNGAS